MYRYTLKINSAADTPVLPAYISLHITLSHRTYCLPTSIVHELTQLDGLSMTLFSIQSSRIISELRSK